MRAPRLILFVTASLVLLDASARAQDVEIVTRLVCMDAGRVIADGDPSEVMADAAVVDAYLGSAA